MSSGNNPLRNVLKDSKLISTTLVLDHSIKLKRIFAKGSTSNVLRDSERPDNNSATNVNNNNNNNYNYNNDYITERTVHNLSLSAADDAENLTINIDDGNSTSNADTDMAFPDGGVKAWLCVLGSFLGLTTTYGLVNSTSAIETYISHNQLATDSASTVGWVFSIYFFVSLVFGIFAGTLFDHHGPRVLIAIGTVLTFAGVFAMGNCTTIYQFIIALAMIAGLGYAVQAPALVGIISHYFFKRRGLAIGLATMGASFGGAIFPVMLRVLYSRLGFVWAMRVFAFVLMILNLGAVVLITPRFLPSSTVSGGSTQSNQEEQRTSSSSLTQQLKDYFGAMVDFNAFKDPRFLYCTIGITFAEMFLMCSMTYLGSYALFTGESENSAYLLITICNAMGILARALAGYASDKLGNFNLMTAMMFAASLFCLIIWLPFGRYTGGLYAFSVAYGLFTPAVLSLASLCVSQISRVEDFGKRFATCYLVVAFAVLAGIPLSGLFIGKQPTNSGYSKFIVFISMLGFLSVGFLIASRWYAVKLRLCIY